MSLKEAIRNRKQPAVSTIEAILLQEVYGKVEKIVDEVHADRKLRMQALADDLEKSIKSLANTLEDKFKTLSTNEQDKYIASLQTQLANTTDSLLRTATGISKDIEMSYQDFNAKCDGLIRDIQKMRGPEGPPGEKGAPGEKGKDGKSVTKEEIIALISPEIEKIKNEIRRANRKGGGGASGGGVSDTQDKAFSGDGSTVAFTLDYKVASNGKAAMVIINGQVQERTTHYTISGKTLTFTTAPEDGTFIWVQYRRA